MMVSTICMWSIILYETILRAPAFGTFCNGTVTERQNILSKRPTTYLNTLPTPIGADLTSSKAKRFYWNLYKRPSCKHLALPLLLSIYFPFFTLYCILVTVSSVSKKPSTKEERQRDSRETAWPAQKVWRNHRVFRTLGLKLTITLAVKAMT